MRLDYSNKTAINTKYKDIRNEKEEIKRQKLMNEQTALQRSQS